MQGDVTFQSSRLICAAERGASGWVGMNHAHLMSGQSSQLRPIAAAPSNQQVTFAQWAGKNLTIVAYDISGGRRAMPLS